MENRAQTIIDEASQAVRKGILAAELEIAELKVASKESIERQAREEANLLIHKLEILREKMITEMSSELIRTAIDISKNLLNAEIAAHPDSIVRVAQAVLSKLSDAKQIYVRANPQDVPFLRENKEKLIQVLEKAKDLDIRVDNQVARGGLLIQTESGLIDAQLLTQLEEIFRATGGV